MKEPSQYPVRTQVSARYRPKLSDLTWNCEICGKERPDNRISVVTYPLKGIPGAERNVKYCNDNRECFDKANIKARTGKI